MAISQLRNVNFGSTNVNLTGSIGVGFAVYDTAGTLISARTTNGVYQTLSGSGIYNAYISFPDNFRGSILWDTGGGSPTYASEQYNYEENNPKVDLLTQISGSIDFIQKIEGGKWKIINNQMIFYATDNSTEVARFNLFDSTGNPTTSAPFERRRV
jgi:hypothetical protein